MQLDLDKIRDKAIQEFRKREKIFCPALWNHVRITNEWFNHITFKDKKQHRRSNQEIAMRFLCFLSVKQILEKSQLYQEYKACDENIEIKKNGKNIIEKRLVQYYGFVGVVKNSEDQHRIRVVVKKIFWRDHIEYVSVMPARSMKWYTNFTWPET